MFASKSIETKTKRLGKQSLVTKHLIARLTFSLKNSKAFIHFAHQTADT